MSELTVQIDLVCAGCGHVLRAKMAKSTNHQHFVDVDPCNECLKQSYCNGNIRGYQEGVEAGKSMMRAGNTFEVPSPDRP